MEPPTPPGDAPEVDYDATAAAYADRLETQLRGFSTGPPFLDLWVPDPDPTEGVLSMVEAAGGAGLAGLAVTLGPRSAAALDATALARRAAALGARVEVERGGGAARVAVSFGHAPVREEAPAPRAAAPARRAPEPEAGGPAPLHPGYLPRMRALLEAPTHEGALPDGPGVRVEAARDGAVLRASVDPGSHRVLAARHEGAAEETLRAALEQLCRAVEGLPIQEASDHGTHRAELALRPDARPVPGVVTPLSAGPPFRACLALAQALLAAYRRATGAPVGANRFVAPPSPRWLALGEAARAAEVEGALRRVAGARGLAESAVALAGIRGETRVTVSFAAGVPPRARRELLLALEVALAREVEPSLVVERRGRRDLSTIRRL